MRTRNRRLAAATVAVTAAAGLAVAAPAGAISRTTDLNCSRRQDYLTFINGGRVCFANAGVLSVAIYGVNIQGSGNNDVYTSSSYWGLRYFPRGRNDSMHGSTVSYIKIL